MRQKSAAVRISGIFAEEGFMPVIIIERGRDLKLKMICKPAVVSVIIKLVIMKGVFPAVKDYSRYKAAYEKRLKQEERKREASALKAARAAKKVASMLARAYGVKKVVLFGSVIDGSFNEASDIDLVVEGLEKGKYIEALVEAERRAGFPVDIKPLEDVRESFRERAQKTGRVLYEK
jgi:uncharacterized protein